MQIIHLLLLLLLFSACTGSNSNPADSITDSLQPVDADKSIVFSADSAHSKSTAMLYADSVISGKIKPVENNEAFAWLDSLQSPGKSTRNTAFQFAAVIMNSELGFLTESVGGHLKTYLQLFPKEFIVNYGISIAATQNKLIENCSYEFFASGDDYAADLENYFGEISKACTDCSSNDKKILANIRSKMEMLIKTKNKGS